MLKQLLLPFCLSSLVLAGCINADWLTAPASLAGLQRVVDAALG